MKSNDQQLLQETYLKKVLLKEETYLEKLTRLNPGWNPEKAKAAFPDEYDPDDAADIEDHVDYEENAAEFIDNISRFTPGVKVGDWVKVSVHGGGGVKSGTYLGHIEGEVTLKGRDFGYAGYKGPTNIPGWSIRVFVPTSVDNFLDKLPGDYAFDSSSPGKVAVARGSITYAQHDEIQSNTGQERYKTYTKKNTFTKIANPNITVKSID